MKISGTIKRRAAWSVYGLVLFGALLVAKAPASSLAWAARRAGPLIVVDAYRGTLWRGQAALHWTVGRGSPSCSVSWRVKPWALLVGRLAVDAKASGDCVNGRAAVDINLREKTAQITGQIAPVAAAPELEALLSMLGPDQGAGRRLLSFSGPIPALRFL